MSTEDDFYNIAQDAIASANQIDCGPGEYRRGLRSIIDEILAAIQASFETNPEA